MRRIVTVFAVMLLVLVGCGVKPTDRETFTVGMECGYAPYNWTQSESNDSAVAIDGNQFCEGYDVQIAKRVAASMERL